MSVEWLDRTPARPLPYYCLCTSEAQYLEAMKYLEFQNPPKWINDNAHATTHTLTNEKGALCCVVCIEIPYGKAKGEIYALLVHEAVHIWQEYCDDIGERKPSAEFEAYTIQAISQALMYSYDSETLERKVYASGA